MTALKEQQTRKPSSSLPFSDNGTEKGNLKRWVVSCILSSFKLFSNLLSWKDTHQSLRRPRWLRLGVRGKWGQNSWEEISAKKALKNAWGPIGPLAEHNLYMWKVKPQEVRQNQNQPLGKENYKEAVRWTIVRAQKGPEIVKVPTIQSGEISLNMEANSDSRRTMP